MYECVLTVAPSNSRLISPMCIALVGGTLPDIGQRGEKPDLGAIGYFGLGTTEEY